MKLSNKIKIISASLAALVLMSCVVGFTVAYIQEVSNGVSNTFVAGAVEVTLNEEFDGTVKKNVNVKNDGDTVSYVRIQLASYRVNEAGEKIAGASAVPDFTPGEGWLDFGNDCYVYADPVAPNASPAAALIGDSGITLVSYSDEDGGKQVIEVVAEAIQASPVKAVKEAWNAEVKSGAITGRKAEK